MELDFECIAIEKDEGTSAILGHAGFIKTVEDLYEAMVGSVPGIKFGIAFAEASGPRLVRSDGNDDGLTRRAESNILKIAAGHTFLILFREAYPINVISNVRHVSEVATIYCATSNPVQVIVAKAETSRSVIGIVDGLSSRAIESEDDKQNRFARPRIQKMTRTCRFALGAPVPEGLSVYRTFDNLISVLSAAGTRRRPR
jgi:adenosine/AMP kinase